MSVSTQSAVLVILSLRPHPSSSLVTAPLHEPPAIYSPRHHTITTQPTSTDIKLLLIVKLNFALVTAYLPAFFAVCPLHSGLITTSKEGFGDGSTSAANANQNPLSAATVEIRQWSDYSVTLLPNTVHSCSRHGFVAVTLTSERPGNVIPFSKTFVLFRVYL